MKSLEYKETKIEKGFQWSLKGHAVKEETQLRSQTRDYKRASFSLEEVYFKERPSCFPQLDCVREFVPL